MFKQILMLATLVAFVTGCGSTPAKIVYQSSKTNKNINVYSVIAQEELMGIYPVQYSKLTNFATGFAVGALGPAALIAGGIADVAIIVSKADTLNDNLSGIRKELEGLDFNMLFEEEIKKKLATNIHINHIKTFDSVMFDRSDIAPSEHYVVLNTQYLMDVDFRTPFIVTEATIKKKGSKKLKIKDKEVYKNTFTYFGKSLPVAAKKINPELNAQNAKRIKEEWKNKPRNIRENSWKKAEYERKLAAVKKAGDPSLSFNEANEISAKAWSTEYKEQLKVNLREGIQDLLSLISDDIKDKTNPVDYRNQGVTIAGYPLNHKSMIIKETEKRQVIRFTEGARAGEICSMPIEEVTVKIVCM